MTMNYIKSRKYRSQNALCSKALLLLLLLLLVASAKHTNACEAVVTVTHCPCRPCSKSPEKSRQAAAAAAENKCKYILQSFRRTEHNETKMLLWQLQLQSRRGQRATTVTATPNAQCDVRNRSHPPPTSCRSAGHPLALSISLSLSHCSTAFRIRKINKNMQMFLWPTF